MPDLMKLSHRQVEALLGLSRNSYNWIHGPSTDSTLKALRRMGLVNLSWDDSVAGYMFGSQPCWSITDAGKKRILAIQGTLTEEPEQQFNPSPCRHEPGKSDSARLAKQLETIARLEKELEESEKRGSELAASYCDGVVGDEYGHTYCRYKAERDAALAEVERLRESKCDPSGSFDRCMKMMYERDENAKQLEVALARVAELEKELAMARDAAAKGDAARHAAGGMEMEIHELKTKLAELEKQEPVAWGAFHFGGKRDGKLYTQCETEAQIETYILDMHRSSDSLTLRKGPLYTAPVVQAQPSVPDGWKPVPMEPTPQMTFVGQSLRYDSVNSIGEIYRQMLAVAPSPIDPAAHPQPCQQPQAHPARCGCER